MLEINAKGGQRMVVISRFYFDTCITTVNLYVIHLVINVAVSISE